MTKTVTAVDNALFSVVTLDVQPLHLDAHLSEQTEFGQRLVNSLLRLGLVTGINVSDTTSGAAAHDASSHHITSHLLSKPRCRMSGLDAERAMLL